MNIETIIWLCFFILLIVGCLDSMLIRFEIVELDNKIKTPDNVSTRDYVKQKFGDRAMEIVKEWISL